jgi:hypothetical protein
MIAVVGCVDYRYALNDRHHQTRFAFALASHKMFVAMSPTGVKKDLERVEIPKG